MEGVATSELWEGIRHEGWSLGPSSSEVNLTVIGRCFSPYSKQVNFERKHSNDFSFAFGG